MELASRTVEASGVVTRLTINVDQPGLSVIVTDVQFSQINQPPPDIVQTDAQFLPGVIVVLPALPENISAEQQAAANGFAAVLALLIDVQLFGGVR